MIEGECPAGTALPGMAVGDQKHGPARHQRLEDVQDLAGHNRIEMGGGFVQQQQRRIAQEGARQRDPLPLAR